jgi:uncharacterized protein HemX
MAQASPPTQSMTRTRDAPPAPAVQKKSESNDCIQSLAICAASVLCCFCLVCSAMLANDHQQNNYTNQMMQQMDATNMRMEQNTHEQVMAQVNKPQFTQTASGFGADIRMS